MTILAVNGRICRNKKNKRINFLAPEPLVLKIGLLARENNLTESDLIRQAIAYFIEENEAKKIEKELEEGYRANTQYYSKMNKDWEVVDLE